MSSKERTFFVNGVEVKCCPGPLPQHFYVLKLIAPLRVFIIHIPDRKAAGLGPVKKEGGLDGRIQGNLP